MSEAPLACSLEVGDLGERLDWIAALTREALRAHRRNGRSLHLIYDSAAAPRVRELVRREQACCGFLDFALSERAHEIELVVTTPLGTDAALSFSYFVAQAAEG